MVDTALPTFVDDAEAEPLARRAAERRRHFTVSVDMYLVIAVGALLAIGLMMVWSTTFFLGASPYTYFFQQARSMAIGAVVMLALSAVDYRIWRRLATPLMGGIVAALVIVLLAGATILSAKRTLFSGAVQPSEPAKLVVVIYMAAWLSSKQGKLRNLTYGLLPFAVLVSVVGGLIIAEPDLSTAALILITSAIMFFLAGAEWLQMGITGLVFIVAGGFAITHINYAALRLQSWLDVIRDPVQAHASHAQNVIIAFLNGGLTGVGLGSGYQKFYNLSVPHSDSIFAVIGEELGLVGCAVVIGLFVVFMLRGYRVARRSPDMFGSLMAAGITTLIMTQALYNIASMATIVPLAGVPLPFISFGGSSLVTVMAGVGLLLSVSRGTAKQVNLAGTRRTIARILDFGGGNGRRSLSGARRR
ncbi:MAG: FtsW/RodA/SpoVE family cell cycle protein [Aggregatilineales bacterium]